MDLVKYSKTARYLMFIPLIVGLLILSEIFLPSVISENEVIDKTESYRAKYNMTTYNLYFQNNNEQFTEEVFNEFEIGDKVKLKTSFFTKEVSSITNLSTKKTFENETNEVYVKYALALVMVISFIYFFRKSALTSKNIKIMLLVIVFTLVNLYRIIKLNI